MSKKTHTNTRFRLTALATAASALSMPLLAAPLDLVQFPAGSAMRLPAPNVILTLDDSGSMRARDAGPDPANPSQQLTRQEALRAALVATFNSSNPDVADGRIRLAWQMLNSCQGFPSNTGGCGNLNMLRSLEGGDGDLSTHRGRFLQWAAQIPASGWTPVHGAFEKAGRYLMRTDSESPWLNTPGDSGSGSLACRRSYHILLTDGGWNMANNYNPDVIPAARRRADRIATTFPDGTAYTPASGQTRIYTNNQSNLILSTDSSWANNVPNGSTISDMAFYFWSTDLQIGIPNTAIPAMRMNVPETITSPNGSSVTLDPYWNPKNDPSTWQNMITYTIGFGDAASFPGLRWDAVTDDMFSTNTARSDYPSLITGQKTWGSVGSSRYDHENKQEMWHAAVNGRGRFIPARNANDLRTAFSSILAQIAADNTSNITSFAASSSSFSRQGSNLYSSKYDANGWQGSVAPFEIDTSGNVQASSAWGSTASGTGTRPKNTADLLDALTPTEIDSRLILTTNQNAAGAQTGIPFTWADLASDLQLALKTNAAEADARGQERLNYIRGDRTREAANGGTLRDRTSRQGDIVNSSIWYTAKPASNYAFDGYEVFASSMTNRMPMLYVGGNDGMLHGFSAVDGKEMIAYVPRGAFFGPYTTGNLLHYTDPLFTTSHRYTVDGSPFVGDVRVGGQWRSYLVGTMAAGGKGYFVLDVTNPGTASGGTLGGTSAPAFAAANASQLVVMDHTDGSDPDIGHIFGEPLTEEGNEQRPLQIVRVNDTSSGGRWALITGNGINSTNARPVLIVQYLDGAREIVKIPAATSGAEATDNGLSTPRPLDVNGDGKVDFVYAGDWRGNLWKFDLSAAVAGNWKVATFNGSATPLYTAVSPTGDRQPITTAPLVKPNAQVGGLMVAFGTGRNASEDDRTDTSVQSFYSVLDLTRYQKDPTSNLVTVNTSIPNPASTGRAQLLPISYNTTATSGSVATSHVQYWTQATTASIDYAAFVATSGASGHRGWYIDLPEDGERVLQSNEFYRGTRVIEIMSIIPASGGNTDEESCSANPEAAKGFRTMVNIETGLPQSYQLMDVNGDGAFNAADNIAGLYASRSTAGAVEGRSAGRNESLRFDGQDKVVLNAPPEVLLRPNWRQLQ